MTFIEKITVVFRRYLEFFISMIIASAAIALLNDSRFITEIEIFAIVVSLFFVVYLVVNVKQTRNCYFDLEDRKWHYILNIIAYGLFVATAYVIYNFIPYEVYRMSFSLANVFKYIYLPCPIHVSAILFHIITFTTIMLAPIGLDKVIAQISWEETEDMDE